LGQALLMARLAGEGGVREREHQISRKLLADDPSTEYQDVHVVVLDALMGRIGVVTDGGPYAAMLVRRNGCPDAAAAHQDPSFAVTARDGTRNSCRVVRIIDGGRVVGAHVANLMTVVAQKLANHFFDGETRVIRSDGKLHHQPLR